MKTKMTMVLLFVGSLGVKAQTKWNADLSHSKLQFSVSHMMISETSGKFKMYDGKVTSTNDDFTDAKIEYTIDVNTIDTDDEKRDAHLKSADFFDVTKFPKMTFVSKSFKKVSGKNYKLVGDLTLHGVTKSVEMDVVYNGNANDPWGNTRAGFKLSGKINRVDFGMNSNTTIVGEEVNITANIELIKQK